MAKKSAKPEAKAEDNPVARWQRELQLSGKHFEPWEERGQKVVDRYRDEREEAETARKFNILWSNVQTLLPALYSRPPKVQVSRRFNDADPVARCASIIIERAVDVELEKYDVGAVIRPAVEDRLLPGRGTAWVRYESQIGQVPQRVKLEGSEGSYQLTDGVAYDGEVEQEGGVAYGTQNVPELQHECTPLDYVYWKDFRCSPARTWEEVRWVARRTYPSREKLVKRFGADIGNAVPLDARPPGLEETDPAASVMSCAMVWEIWDKVSKCVYWVHESHPQMLDTKADPLKVNGFFPCPKPLSATLTSGSLVPIPDYCQYQDQAKELDDLTDRISHLTKALKVVGVHDATCEALARVLNEGVENQMIPVNSWSMFAEKGGLKGAMDFVPIQQVIDTVIQLYNARAQVKQDLYEVTGIGDVIRGATDPNETATAQGIKAKYAGLRLSEHQTEVERFARDLIRLKAEVMAEKYAPETLVAMSGILETPEGMVPPQPPVEGQPPMPAPPKPDPMNPQTWPPQVQAALQLLKSPTFRDFRIDIETKSMAQMDEQADQQARVQFLQAVGGFMAQATAAAKEQPAMAELLGELLRFGVRGFRIGRELESVFDRAIEAAGQSQGMPPEIQKQIEDAKKQAEQQQQEIQKRGEAVQAEEAGMQDEKITMAEERMRLENDKAALAAERRVAMLEGQNQMLKIENFALKQGIKLENIAAGIDNQVKDAAHGEEMAGMVHHGRMQEMHEAMRPEAQ
jgi:hypothetical protein